MMKRLAAFGATLLFATGTALATVSCSDGTPSTAPAPGVASRAVAEAPGQKAGLHLRMGQLHNESMEYVRKELEKEAGKKRAKLTEDEVHAVAQQSLDRFYSIRGFGKTQAGQMQGWRDRLTRMPNAAGGDLFKDELRTVQSVEGTVSPLAQAYLEEILSLVDQTASIYELEWLRQQLAALEQRASGELSGEELNLVYTVSSIAVHSLEYWPAEAQNWVSTCQEVLQGCAFGDEDAPIRTMGWNDVNWKKVGLVDVVGGITGGIMGGPKGALVTAAGASAISVIMQW